MISRNLLVVFFILTLVAIVAAWSKLRFVEEADHEPQRWRLEDHPAFNKQSGAN